MRGGLSWPEETLQFPEMWEPTCSCVDGKAFSWKRRKELRNFLEGFHFGK